MYVFLLAGTAVTTATLDYWPITSHFNIFSFCGDERLINNYRQCLIKLICDVIHMIRTRTS